MTGNKTLVIITPAFPANEAETFWVPSQQLMVKALQKNFPDLRIIILTLLYPYQAATYTWNGMEITSFNGNHKRKLRRIFLWRSVWKKLTTITNNHDVIAILSFWCGECAFIGNRFAKRKSLKHFSWICGQDARKINKWVRFIRPAEHELLAMSPFLAEEFYKNHNIKPRYIIPNAIDAAAFQPSMPVTKDIDILGVGSFEPLKRYDVFINVINVLQKSLPRIMAFHCGMGREKEKIDQLINDLSLQENVQLLGGKTHEEILQLMRRTKVFLHTSGYEGFSTVCLEALCAGAHVISFCYPLTHPVAHWHVVTTEEEMQAKALQILQNGGTDYTSILLYSMDDSAIEMMNVIEDKRPIPELNDTQLTVINTIIR